MRRRVCYSLIGLAGVASVAVLCIAGCESVSTTQSSVLSITPASMTLTNITIGGETVIFTASGNGTNQTVYTPLTWQVSNSGLGFIKSSAGVTAIYESRPGTGNNSVTVSDQAGAEGVAVVIQQ